MISEIAPKLTDLTVDVLNGQVWARFQTRDGKVVDWIEHGSTAMVSCCGLIHCLRGAELDANVLGGSPPMAVAEMLSRELKCPDLSQQGHLLRRRA